MIATWPPDAPRGSVSLFCRENEVSRSRFYEIRAAARAQGVLAAVAPSPPRAHPARQVPVVLEEAAVRIRKELAEQGWDHGPISVRHQMLAAGLPAPSRASLARIFARRGLVVPAPAKRPRSAWRRFTFAFVHECWQLDATQWPLADGTRATVFQLLDDHSRYLLGSVVEATETSTAAVAVMQAAVATYQAPLLLLTDNGLAMNPHRRGYDSALAEFARSIGTRPITSRIYHPQTCGKNERVHATLQRWLRAQPLPATVPDLRGLVERFDHHYNHDRPHQALSMRTPAQALADDPRASPPTPPPPPPTGPQRPARHDVRTTRVGTTGSVRVQGSRFINLGIEFAGSDVVTVIENTTAAVFDHHGTHLRTVTLVPGQRYYGTGTRRGGPPRPRRNDRIDRPPTVRSH